MSSLLAIYIVILWIANVGLCVWLAGEKERSQVFWGVASFFLGLLATLFLVGAPVSKEKED